jgi:hypothetical protein
MIEGVIRECEEYYTYRILKKSESATFRTLHARLHRTFEQLGKKATEKLFGEYMEERRQIQKDLEDIFDRWLKKNDDNKTSEQR